MAASLYFLLVDDDLDDISLFEEVLKEVNPHIRFKTAQNGLEALEYLRNANYGLPDLIFLDLNMPRMDGKQCLGVLKNDPYLQHIPVIMYTTSSLSRDIEETMQNGAICFITKPSSINELRHILSSIISGIGTLESTLFELSNDTGTFIIC